MVVVLRVEDDLLEGMFSDESLELFSGLSVLLSALKLALDNLRRSLRKAGMALVEFQIQSCCMKAQNALQHAKDVTVNPPWMRGNGNLREEVAAGKDALW